MRRLLLVLFLLPTFLFARVEDLSVDARSIVLRNVAENDVYHAAFYNPALNVFAKDNYFVSGSYVPLENDENIMQVLGSFPFFKGNAEVNYSQFVSRGVEVWTDNNVFKGNNDYVQNLLGLLYSEKIRTFDVGARLNIESANVGGESIYSKKYLDLGVNKIFARDLAVGFSLLNFGDTENFKMGFGLNKKYYLDWYFSLFKAKNEDTEISIAAEHDVAKNLKIYAGLDNDLLDSYMDFLSGVKLGFSLDFGGDKSLNYAFSKRGELGYLNYLTFNYRINKTVSDKNKQTKVEKEIAQTKKEEHYKVVVIDNSKNSEARNFVIKYLQYNKRLNILDDLVYEKEDIYKSTDSLKAHLIIKTEIIDLGENFRIFMNIFDVYEGKTVKDFSQDFYTERNLELTVRNMVFVFLDEYENKIKQGVHQKELARITKILEENRRKELLAKKRKAKFEKVKKFKEAREKRILDYKKMQKVEKIKEFEEARKKRNENRQDLQETTKEEPKI